MGCVFSSILTHRFDDVPATIGTPTLEQLALHHRKLEELRFEGARLYCEDYQLDEELIALFRAQHGAMTL